VSLVKEHDVFVELLARGQSCVDEASFGAELKARVMDGKCLLMRDVESFLAVILLLLFESMLKQVHNSFSILIVVDQKDLRSASRS